MSFRVTVYPIAHRGCVESEPPTDDAEFRAWNSEYMKHVLVDVPLGGDGDVGRHWSAPAAHLGLPLIASIYDNGLTIEGEQLDALGEEVARLVHHWRTVGIDDGDMARFWKSPVPHVEHLYHRSELLDVAIQVAKVAPGYLNIS